MLRILRHVKLLTAVILLLSGGVYTAVSAQGLACARKHIAPAAVDNADGSIGSEHADDSEAVSHEVGGVDRGGAHTHHVEDLPAPPVVCTGPAVHVQRSPTGGVRGAHHILPGADHAPMSLLIQSHFRPPRLS